MPLKIMRDPPLASQRNEIAINIIRNGRQADATRSWTRVMGAVAFGAALAFLAWQMRM